MAKKSTSKKASSGIDPKLAGLLSWLFSPLSSVIFMIMEDTKADEFTNFHAKQSLFWFVAEVVLYTISGVIATVTFGLLFCLPILVGLFALGVRIYAAYKAYQGEKIMLPVIGDMASK